METLSTLINFVGKGNFSPAVQNSVTTGDVVGFVISAILACAILAALLNMFSKRHQNSNSTDIGAKTLTSKRAIVAFALAFATIAVFLVRYRVLLATF